MPLPEPRPIDNHLARRTRHRHPEDEPEMHISELCAHMIKFHGWTVGMILRRGGYDGGDYLRRAHERQHLKGQWPTDPVPDGF